jgi:hypothetical protein
MLGALALAGWGVLIGLDRLASLDSFGIRSVTVDGLRYVRAGDLLSYSGDPAGGSVFRIDVDGMAERISTHPWVKGVSVRRELPDAVKITVDERKPAALAVTPDGGYLVDGEGWVLAMVRGSDWDFLPSFVYEGRERLGIGGGNSARMLNALKLITTVRSDKTELLAGGVVFVNQNGDPVLRYRGTDVLFGSDEYETKVTRLTDVIPDVYRRGVEPEVIDLRFPGKVVVDGAGGKTS